MNILTRYLQKRLWIAVAGAACLLTFLKSFIDFGAELRDIGSGHYSVGVALGHTVLLMPSALYEFLPIAVLLGVLLSMGALAGHNELLIMRASGASKATILRMVASGVLLLMIPAVFIGEVVAPYAVNEARQVKTIAVSGGSAYKTMQGLWLRSNHDFLYVSEVQPSGDLTGVVRYHVTPNDELTQVSYAKHGRYEDQAWVFHNIKTTHLTEQGAHTERLAQQRWPLGFKPDFLKLSQLQPNEKPLWTLYDQINTRKRNGLDVSDPSFHFWQRLFQPVAALVMLLVVMPFMFGDQRHMSVGLRMVFGALMGIGFYLMERFAGPMSMVVHIPPFIAAIMPIAILALVGMGLMRRS